MPSLLYFAAFCALTYGLITSVFSHLWGLTPDSLMTLWGLNWVGLTVTHPNLYPSLWHTDLIWWPSGTSLIGHDLSPFNGFLALPLLRVLSLPATYNAILVFGFVVGGLTAYWLAFYLTGSFWASVIGGFVYTFSGYHFAHAIGGHLGLVSLEWIPLFVLCWYVLLTKPSALPALGAAIALWLVLLCNFYYFFFCVLLATLMVAWFAAVRHDAWFIVRHDYRLALLTFVVLTLSLAGPIVGRFVLTSYRDPFLAVHDPRNYSLDVLAPIIPGGSWRFAEWTRFYWQRLPGNVSESTLQIPLPLYVVAAFAWMRRKALAPALRQSLSLWLLVVAVFTVLALGPALQVGGKVLWDGAMPYSLLVAALPSLKLSGVPERMMVIVTLGAGVLSAVGFRELFSASTRMKAAALFFLAIVAFESLPAYVPAAELEVPEYVSALAALPEHGGVLDLDLGLPHSLGRGLVMYYQTIFQKPLVYGYISRHSVSVRQNMAELDIALANWDYGTLRDVYHIGYIVAREPIPAARPDLCLRTVYDKDGVIIYRVTRKCR